MTKKPGRPSGLTTDAIDKRGEITKPGVDAETALTHEQALDLLDKPNGDRPRK